MSNTHLDRATILTEALPYIQRYNGKIVVVNCGGVAMNQELRDAVATDITLPPPGGRQGGAGPRHRPRGASGPEGRREGAARGWTASPR